MSTESKNTWSSQISTKGEFIRKETTFRNKISADPTSEFPAEPDRYHLYVAYACPWAHRTLTVRALKGLEDVISFSPVEPFLDQGGWSFNEKYPDPLLNSQRLKELYLLTDPNYGGSITVPVLFDKKQKKIVNNESSEIIRMLNSEFNKYAKNPELDLYPEEQRAQIDELNAWIYPGINNGVYQCGFARSQEAYSTAFKRLFESLEKVESILSTKRFLTGNSLTEADVRLWTTLVRFDPVYYVHFKCNGKRILDYPNCWGFVKDIYQTRNVKGTVNMHEIKVHYYTSHTSINPFQIVPDGPLDANLDESHDRATKFSVSGF
eukprot:TRINITY_DN442_c0_g1_i1.p1 TRINITY_DN442_c0_g1~~TRINITY_DN442_c0_g1_i1.p1  ORF type:complete len:321 (-),score=51.76 TRINITY_DN442_c0_g1_i1:34-996(-)